MSKDFIGVSSAENIFLIIDAIGSAKFEQFRFKGTHFVLPVGSGANS